MNSPSYYAVIPASVRYSAISASAKLLYGELTALCQAEGFCWAKNDYFAGLYGAGERSVLRWLAELVKAGFIVVDGVANQHGQRKIYLAEAAPPNLSALTKVASQKCRGTIYKDEQSRSNIEHTPLSPTEPKASSRANPVSSVAVLLAELEAIPNELRAAAERRQVADIADEWAKFRNHHISARSKHTRVDLCWDTWCRNAAKWQGGRAAPGGGGAGQGGVKRHDHMAAATDRALVELFGVRREGHGGTAVPPAAGADPWGGGGATVDAEFVDAGAGDPARLEPSGGVGGGGQSGNA